MTLASIAEAAARYRRPEGVVLEYGTAGFRTRATLLDSTFFRMGMLAALRSRALGGLAVGLMVTASHNGACDNGIKLVDPDGGMLTQAWEKHASAVANADEGLLAQALQAVALEECFDPHAGEALVMVGRDTREHSMRLSAIATEGATLLGANLQDNALCTTPQLSAIAAAYAASCVLCGFLSVRLSMRPCATAAFSSPLHAALKQRSAPPRCHSSHAQAAYLLRPWRMKP